MVGVLRREIEDQLRMMSFDVRNVMLRIPLQAVWTAIEELDVRITEMQLELEDESAARDLEQGWLR